MDIKVPIECVEVRNDMDWVRCFQTMNGLRIIVGKEPIGWHISYSRANRYPEWDEMRDMRYKIIPAGITLVMVLPPKGEYVNVHPNCFHWHEAKLVDSIYHISK